MQCLARGIFEIEQEGDTLIVVPTVNLCELDYQRIQEDGKQVLDLLNANAIKYVILDFAKTDYYGSTALGFFLKFWKAVRTSSGRMAFCNVSDLEKQILEITHLDRLWPICSSRTEALEAVRA